MNLNEYMDAVLQEANDKIARKAIADHLQEVGISYSSDRMEHLITALTEDDKAWHMKVECVLNSEQIGRRINGIMEIYDEQMVNKYNLALALGVNYANKSR